MQGQTVRLPLAGEIMPHLTFVSASGERVRVFDYRRRRNLVLIFGGVGLRRTRGLRTSRKLSKSTPNTADNIDNPRK